MESFLGYVFVNQHETYRLLFDSIGRRSVKVARKMPFGGVSFARNWKKARNTAASRESRPPGVTPARSPV
jgi:hypothetical protein